MESGQAKRWFGCETLGRAIYVAVILPCNTYPKLVADQVQRFMETVFPDGTGLFHTSKTFQYWFMEQKVQGDDFASTFPRFQFDQASVECAGQIGLINRGHTS